MKLNKKHIAKFSVEFDLCDAGGVLYHPNYLVLADRARAKAMESAHFPYSELWKLGQALALIDVSMKYLNAVYFGESVIIITHVKKIKGSRIFLRQEMFSSNEIDLNLYHEGKFYNVDEVQIKSKGSFSAEITLVPVKLHPIKAAMPRSELLDMLTK